MSQIYFVVSSHNHKIITAIPKKWLIYEGDQPKLNENCEWYWPKQKATVKSKNNESVQDDWTRQYGTVLRTAGINLKL